MIKKKSARKRKAELIEEDEFIQSLPAWLRFVFGMFKYNLKEILFVIALVFFGLWLLTSFNYKGDKFEIKSGVKIDIQKDIAE